MPPPMAPAPGRGCAGGGRNPGRQREDLAVAQHGAGCDRVVAGQIVRRKAEPAGHRLDRVAAPGHRDLIVGIAR